MPKDYASAGIQDFLNSKADATTYLGFKVGQNGFLTASPSLRVFLLDYLAQVDPAAAASYATGILTTMDSPDEWAVALRDYARGNSGVEGRAFLEQKLEAMLTHDAWLREPSVGFLEAFDLAAFVGGRKLVAPLTDLVRRKDNQAVARAAFLALDRMVIREPLEMLTVLEQRPDMMSGREQTRANYFARGDVRDPTQRRIVESYLLDPKRDPSEVQAFAAAFPNANYMISRNLLTVVETPDGNTLLQRDRETLPVIGEWMTDPRFEQLRPHLARTQQRLSNFVRQAETSRGP